MTALIEIIINGVKEFSGQIVAAILLAIAFAIFPSLRKLFRKKNESDEEVKQRLEQLQNALDQTLQKDNSEEGLRKQLEILQQEEQQLASLKKTLKRHDSVLQNIQAQTEEEKKQKADLQKQIEEQRREEERVKAEIQRKQEELRQEETRKAKNQRCHARRGENTGGLMGTLLSFQLPETDTLLLSHRSFLNAPLNLPFSKRPFSPLCISFPHRLTLQMWSMREYCPTQIYSYA